jgi:uncharacterized membrane protein
MQEFYEKRGRKIFMILLIIFIIFSIVMIVLYKFDIITKKQESLTVLNNLKSNFQNYVL